MAVSRGRLIFPTFVTIERLDVEATRVASGYDEIFRETQLSSTADGLGESMRENKTVITVPCQLEEKHFFEKLNMVVQGNAPHTLLFLTFHVGDLKRLGYWYEDNDWGGRPALNVGDQILGFKDRYNQQLFKVPKNPGLYIVEVKPTGFLSTQNLIVCVLGDRAQSSSIAERGG